MCLCAYEYRDVVMLLLAVVSNEPLFICHYNLLFIDEFLFLLRRNFFSFVQHLECNSMHACRLIMREYDRFADGINN